MTFLVPLQVCLNKHFLNFKYHQTTGFVSFNPCLLWSFPSQSSLLSSQEAACVGAEVQREREGAAAFLPTPCWKN